MKRLIIAFGILLLLHSCTKKSNNIVAYTISSVTKENTPLLRVHMSFLAQADGETTVLFQDKGWGETNLHDLIHNIKVLSEESEIVQNRDSNWFVINHPKKLKTITLEYEVKQDTEGDLTTKKTYRPIIQPNYFHVFSHNLLLLPRDYATTSDATFDVNITWEGFSEDFSLLNSFGNNKQYQYIQNTSEREFHSAVFTGGDFRSYSMDIDSNDVVFGIRGTWQTFNDSTMVNILKKTVKAQRDFWKDHTQDYFAVTMIPTHLDRGSSFQGTGLTDSFATSASNNENLELEGLVYLLNHELQHNWTGHVIKNDNEEEQYWFSEGFTDYYTIKNIATHKIYNLDQSYFIQELNGFIKALYTSPVKEAPNSEITYDNIWTNGDYQKLPYRRGALFAFYLDHKIKTETEGKYTLDDVMLSIKDAAITKDQKVTHTYFISEVNKYLNTDIKPFFDTHIENGQLLELEAIFKDFGFEYEPKSKVFDLGFTFSDDKKYVITINKDSEAYKAGLRINDTVIKRSYYQSAEYEAEFTILRNGKEIDVKYYPAKQADIPTLKDNSNNKNLLSF